MSSNKFKNSFDLKVFYISWFIFGYPICALLSELFYIDWLTIFYRLSVLLSGFLVTVKCISNGETRYQNFQFCVLFLNLTYFCFVLFYFSNGFENTVLTLNHFFNNVILFTVLPILLFSFKINDVFINRLKVNTFYFSLLLLFLIYLAYFLGLSEEYRLSFSKLNPISLSLYCAISVIVFSWNKKEIGFSYYILVIISIYAMIESGSRGPLISLGLIIIYIAIKQCHFKYYPLILSMCTLLSFLIYNFFSTVQEYIPILSRFDISSEQGGLSVTIREKQYLSAVDIFLDNPFFGGSLVEKFKHFYPHNLILEALMSGGLFLFSLYFFVFTWFFYKYIHSNKSLGDKNLFFLTCILLITIISNMTSSSLASSGLMFFIMVLISKYEKNFDYNR